MWATFPYREIRQVTGNNTTPFFFFFYYQIMIYYIFARTTKRASHPAFHIELSQLWSNIYHGLSRTASLKRSPDGELGRQGPSNYSSGLIFPKLRFWKLAQLMRHYDERTIEHMTQNTMYDERTQNTMYYERTREHTECLHQERLFFHLKGKISKIGFLNALDPISVRLHYIFC